MKAKDYAKKFYDNPSNETLVTIGRDFLRECEEIAENRNCKTDDAILAIFREQNQKWESLSRLIGGLKKDGFKEMVRLTLPEIYRRWMN